MTALAWDQTGEKTYETGVDRGVLYQIDINGEYTPGVAWNGLTNVTESPSGAEPNKQYADNQVYLTLMSAEEFAATIEAFTYPTSFGQNDGSAEPSPGVSLGQQLRKQFGFCYRSKVGNDVMGVDYGYKVYLVYGCQAAPSEKAHSTINDSPEATAFSWEISTIPVNVGTVNGTDYKPLSTITIDSTKVDPAKLAILEQQLYGSVGVEPSMPLPADVIAMMGPTPLTLATPTQPSFNQGTNTITIPSITGVVYKIDGVTKPPGAVVITANKIVTAHPATGYKFPAVTDVDWLYPFV
jgi:hypothetical protein